jgi:hypothetical protein
MQDSNIEQFQSYPSHSCFISVERINGEKILKIDFSVKDYHILNGVQNHKFPDNVVVNDKIYLDEKLKDKIIKDLDIFIKTENLNIGYKTNPYGFLYNEFVDFKGNIILIEDAAIINEPCIWLGCKSKDVFIDNGNSIEKYNFQAYQGNVIIKNKIRLSPEEAQNLKEIMQKQWIMYDVNELKESLPINSKNTNKLKI